MLFAAAALRRLGIPTWGWVLFLAVTGGVLVLLHHAGAVRYAVDPVQPPPFLGWAFGQFLGLGVGRIGVAVNAVAATVWIASRRAGYPERLPRRETGLLAGSYGTMALATAMPAACWAVGLGVVPLTIELPVVLVGAGLLTTVLLLRWRRLRRAGGGALDHAATAWPTDAVVVVWLVGALAVGPLFAGSGLPDATLTRRSEAGGPIGPAVSGAGAWRR